MITVVDQHKPWLTPSRTLANTIQPQLGAQMMSSGTGSPASQPATSSGLRPIRSASRSEEHTSELQSRLHLVCRLLLEKKKTTQLSLTASPSNIYTYMQLRNCLQFSIR